MSPTTLQQWMPLVYTTGDNDDFAKRYDTHSQANVVRFLTFDQDNPNSILSSLYLARDNARGVREVMSTEMWEQINRAYLTVLDARWARGPRDDPSSVFVHVRRAIHAFVGLTEATLSRNVTWHFLRMGRMLERADKTSRAIDVKYFILLPTVEYVGSPYDNLLWATLLRSLSGFEMYRKRHHQIYPKGVVEFLVLDQELPRSIHHCLAEAERSLLAISDTRAARYSNRAEQLLGRMRAEMDFTDVDEIFDVGLHEYLDTVQKRLNAVGDAIAATFFTADAEGVQMQQQMSA